MKLLALTYEMLFGRLDGTHSRRARAQIGLIRVVKRKAVHDAADALRLLPCAAATGPSR